MTPGVLGGARLGRRGPAASGLRRLGERLWKVGALGTASLALGLGLRPGGGLLPTRSRLRSRTRFQTRTRSPGFVVKLFFLVLSTREGGLEVCVLVVRFRGLGNTWAAERWWASGSPALGSRAAGRGCWRWKGAGAEEREGSRRARGALVAARCLWVGTDRQVIVASPAP